ncbi:MAG: DUF4126 family protein [Mucilaginibacter sp.]
MKLTISKPFWQVFGLGVLAGMRATSAPAVASHILSHHHSQRLANSPLKFMQLRSVALGMKILAGGELIGDKLPGAPNRINVTGIAARCLSGSLAGASIYKASGKNALTGAVIGSMIALGATYGSFYLRKAAVDKTHILDPFVGALEDALVLGAASGLAITA